MASDWPAVAMWTLTLGRRSAEPKQVLIYVVEDMEEVCMDAVAVSVVVPAPPPPPSDVRGKWRRYRDASLPFPDHGESECAAAFLPKGTNLRVVMASPLVGAGAGGHHESRP